LEEEENEEEQLQKVYQQKLQQLQIEEQKKALLRRILTPEAYERMMNVRISNPAVYNQVVNSLAYFVQSGQYTKITDQQLYKLLAKFSQKRESKIEFKEK
jgi:programmed cell death protein 5